MSTIHFTGNLANDPEIHFLPDGTPVATLTVLENRRVKTADGWKDGEANRFVVKVWRSMAENVAESLSKGDRVSVIGSVKTDTWEDKETGENRYRQIVDADDVAYSLKFHTVQARKATRGSDQGAQQD